jgi:hypothetical protein
MIPLDIIKKNAVLEEHILAKDIIAAMKWYSRIPEFHNSIIP